MAYVAEEKLTVASNLEEKGIVPMQSAPRNEPAPVSPTMDIASSFFKNTGELLGKLDAVPKQAMQLKDVFDIVGNISSGMDGMSELFTKEHLTLSDGLSIAGKIASGVVGVLEAMALGPEAGVISASAMIGGSIISYVTDLRQKQGAYTAAKQQEYEKAKGTFIMNDGGAGAYIDFAAKISRPPTHKWKMPGTDPARDVMRSQGKGAYDLTNPIPMAVADQMAPKNYMPVITRYNLADDLMPIKKSYFEEMAGLRKRLLAAGYDLGNQAFLNEALQSKEYAARYDKEHGTHTLEKTLLTIKETAYHVVDQANDGRQIVDDLPAKQRRRAVQPNGTVGKSVVINVNRPLIEHLTITSASVNDGVDNMRRQIEEALLDILNSTDIR
jgi:hypothetical protein